jgi:hypothetical protein
MARTITKTGAQSAAEDAASRQETADHARPAAKTRACPTRAEGPAPLFQHTLTVSQCQSKQRGLYHKCFTCVHANAR